MRDGGRIAAAIEVLGEIETRHLPALLDHFLWRGIDPRPVLGIAVLFKSLTIETEGGDSIGAIAWRPLLVIVGAIVAFALLLFH